MGIATRLRPRATAKPRAGQLPPLRPPFVPRDRRGRARKNVLLGLLAFGAVQLLIFGLLQLHERFRDPHFGDKKRQLERMLAARERPFLLLALGSSRTGMGFRGDLVGEKLTAERGEPVLAFNFGIPAVGPVLQSTYLNRLLADGIRPDLLLLEVHPGMLGYQFGKPIERRGLFVEQLRLSEIPAIRGTGYLSDTAELDWWGANLCPTHGARFPLLGRLLPNWLPATLRLDWGRKTDPWGWNASAWASPPPELRAMGMAKAKEEYEAMLTELTFEAAPVEALRRILATAREREIPVVLLLMPEGPVFRGWYPDAVKRRIESFVASLGTPCVNARDWVEELDFLDSHHLLPSGATRFSERLAGVLATYLK